MRVAVIQESDAVVIAVSGALTREDLPLLADWFEALLERVAPTAVVCSLAGLATVDLIAVDALARLRLRSRRRGCALVVRGAPPPLRALVELLGLADVLPSERPLGLETRGEVEQREQARGVEEERDAGDLTA